MKNMMLRQLLVCVCLVSSPLAAMAGDSWTGAYAGLHYGSTTDSTRLVYSPTTTSQSFNLSGNIYGIHAGYDAAAGDHLILGGELQYSLSEAEGKNFCPSTTWTCGAILDNLTSLRGHVGYGGDTFMLYGLLGWATADVQGYTASGGVGHFGRTNQVEGPQWGFGMAVHLSSSMILRAEYSKYVFAKEDYKVDFGSRVEIDYQPTTTTVALDWHF